MNVYISTANQYLNLLKPFSFLFNRYWSDKQIVNILGYDNPKFILPDNFNFISMGKQEGGIQAWSSDLRKFFNSIDDKFFIWATEDMFLTYHVNHELLNYILNNYLTSDVGRFGLTNDNKGRPHSIMDDFNSVKIIQSEQTVNYRLSVLWSIWNKEYLLKYMLDRMSPWEFEIKGSEMAKNDNYKILGCSGSYPIHQCLAVRKRNLNQPLSFNAINKGFGLDNNVIDEMRHKGMINEENKVSS